MKLSQRLLPDWVKQILAIGGLLLALLGLMLGFGFVCLILLLVIEGDEEAISVGLAGFTFLALTLGAGGTIFWHSQSSLQNKPSKVMRLPSVWGIAGMFTVYIIIGTIIFQSDFAAGLFFPLTVLVAVSLPSLCRLY